MKIGFSKADITPPLGTEPPIFTSSNVDGGDAKNVELYAKYYGYWK